MTRRPDATRTHHGHVPLAGRRGALQAAVAVVAAGCLAATEPVQAAAAGPMLARGLNLTHWFEYERGQAVTADEMRALRQLGFDHVRLPLDAVVCGWRPEAPSRLPFIAELRAAVTMALAAGLEVVVDLHLTHPHKMMAEERPELELALAALWRALAGAFADTPADRVAFELLNEPQYYGLRALRWPALQRRLLDAVRERAPAHLVLLSGNEGGSFQGLSNLRPEADTRVAYVFHHYEPFLFTHQGAAWLDDRYTTAGLRSGVRYPVQAQGGQVPGLTRPHPRAAQELREYLDADWGADRIRAVIDRAGAWAREHGVRVLCNEFGVIRAHVDPGSRYRWVNDVRVALEANRIGWTLWDYTDIFGITAESAQPNRAGLRTIEPAALRALGLAPR